MSSWLGALIGNISSLPYGGSSTLDGIGGANALAGWGLGWSKSSSLVPGEWGGEGWWRDGGWWFPSLPLRLVVVLVMVPLCDLCVLCGKSSQSQSRAYRHLSARKNFFL